MPNSRPAGRVTPVDRSVEMVSTNPVVPQPHPPRGETAHPVEVWPDGEAARTSDSEEAPATRCPSRTQLGLGLLAVLLIAAIAVAISIANRPYATGVLPMPSLPPCQCQASWTAVGSSPRASAEAESQYPSDIFNNWPQLPLLQDFSGYCVDQATGREPGIGDTSASPVFVDSATRIDPAYSFSAGPEEEVSDVIPMPIALAAWSEVVVVQSGLTMGGFAFGASGLASSSAWTANCTAIGSLQISKLEFSPNEQSGGAVVSVQISVPVRISLIRGVMVSTPVSPLRRSGMFSDPLEAVQGSNGVFSTEKLNLGGAINRTIPTLLEIPIPSLTMLLAAVEGRSTIAARLLRQGRAPTATASLSVMTSISSLQGQRTLPQGVVGGTRLRCEQLGTIRVAAVALRPPSDEASFVTDSAFDFRSIAAVTRTGLMDSVSNANMINLLREHGVNSLVYPDLLPRPKIVLADSRASVAEANASGWSRLMIAAGTPDTPIPQDIAPGFQQPVRSPLPTPSTGSTTPPAFHVPLPLAGVKEVGFPVPEGAQRWFGVGHNLPSAQTTFRFIFESSYENVPVFSGPPYNGTLNPEFERMFKMVLLATAEQINATGPGLLSKSHALLIDEVYLSVPETRRNWVSLASFHRAVLPQVRLWQTAAISDILALSDHELTLASTWVINSPTPATLLELEGRIDRAMANSSNSGIERPRVILYDNGVPALDMPLLRQRLFQWGAWLSNNPIGAFNGTASRQVGVSGTLSFYTVAAWGPTSQTVSVWDDPSVQDPVHRRPGWGLLVYPPEGGSPAEPVTSGGESDPVVPVTSLRMVAMRSGLQDVEILRQLAQTVTLNGTSRCPPTSCIERARLFGQALLRTQLPQVTSWIPLDWSRTWRDSFSNESYTIDPEDVTSFRRAALSVIAAIPSSLYEEM